MKKYLSIVLFLSVIILLSSCGQAQTEEKKNSVYATVNGEKIMTDEIDYFRTRCRSQIINDYAEKYGVKDFSDFWDKDFDGTTPSDSLEKKALEEAADAKVRLVMMRENGVYDDISFEALKAKAEKFNAENANTKGNVGINSIDMNGFYTYYVSTGEMELKNVLAEGELKPTEQELEKQAKESPELTQNGLISKIVAEKYDAIILEKINSAKIEKASGN